MQLCGYACSFLMATAVPSDPTEGSANIFPITPSRLPACTPESRSAERRRTLGAGRAALVLVAVCLRHGRSANAGGGAGRDQEPFAAPRPLAPSLAWRRAGKLA